MKDRIKTNFLWSLIVGKKSNYTIIFFIFFFGFLAAILEGLSFSSLLVGFSFLTKEFSEKTLFFQFLKHFEPYTLFLASVLCSIVFQILRSFFSYLSQFMTSFITVHMQQKVQEKIYSQIFSFSYSHVSFYKMGDLINYTSAPTTFFPRLMDGINRIIVCALMIIGYLIFMFFLSVSLTLMILTIFIITTYLQKKILQRIRKASEEQATHIVDLSKETAQNFEGFKLIHLFQRQEKILKKIKSTLLQISNSTFKVNKWDHLITPINECIGVFLAGTSLVLGFFFLKTGSFPLFSLLLTFLTLTYRLGTRSQIILACVGNVVCLWGSIQRISEILKKEDKEFYEKKILKCPPFQRQMDFDNVSFSYPFKSQYAIKNLTFKIERGKTIAIVGKSGSGKSTLLDLLLRLYIPTSGNILMDGLPISEYELSSWRSLFGVVPQDPFLFHDTIKENIRFGNLDARNEMIIEVSKQANAHDFISQLPDGYQTVIGERGYRLSGGERQRIALARALVRNHEILVLDEATSHLDSQSELFIQKSLENLRGKKTLIVVAHRLSTIALADEIYVLEKGSIMERGTHQNLLNLGGNYSSLWNIQSNASSKEVLL